jgi:hypothetical protein
VSKVVGQERWFVGTLTVQMLANVLVNNVSDLPRSNGCVKKVAKQLALPPNQNGYEIDVTFTSLLLLNSGALTFFVSAAIMITNAVEAAYTPCREAQAYDKRNCGVTSSTSVVVMRPRCRRIGEANGRHSVKHAGVGNVPGLASHETASTCTQPEGLRYSSLSMRIPLSSAALCRQICRNASLRIQRPALSPWLWLYSVRHNSSGKFVVM